LTKLSIFGNVRDTMAIIHPGEGREIGHAKQERHEYFIPLFSWASEISDSVIARPLELILNKLSTLWSRAGKDKENGRPADQGIEEFIACLRQVEELLGSSSPGTEDFIHLNNILIALKDVLLVELKKRQKLGIDENAENSAVRGKGRKAVDNNIKIREENRRIVQEGFKKLFLWLGEIKSPKIKRQIREGLKEFHRAVLEMLKPPDRDDHRVMAQARAQGLVANIEELRSKCLPIDKEVLIKMSDHIKGPVMEAILSTITVEF
jgi:hypothetical protein